MVSADRWAGAAGLAVALGDRAALAHLPIFVHRLGEFVIVRESGKLQGVFDRAEQAVVIVVLGCNDVALSHTGIR